MRLDSHGGTVLAPGQTLDLQVTGVVSNGGITTCDDACARIDAGATLVQAYTGFIYGGPAWPARMARAAR